MQYIIQVARHMNELTHIVMVILKLLKWKQVRYIVNIACKEIIHSNNMEAFFDKSITQMGS